MHVTVNVKTLSAAIKAAKTITTKRRTLGPYPPFILLTAVDDTLVVRSVSLENQIELTFEAVVRVPGIVVADAAVLLGSLKGLKGDVLLTDTTVADGRPIGDKSVEFEADFPAFPDMPQHKTVAVIDGAKFASAVSAAALGAEFRSAVARNHGVLIVLNASTHVVGCDGNRLHFSKIACRQFGDDASGVIGRATVAAICGTAKAINPVGDATISLGRESCLLVCYNREIVARIWSRLRVNDFPTWRDILAPLSESFATQVPADCAETLKCGAAAAVMASKNAEQPTRFYLSVEHAGEGLNALFARDKESGWQHCLAPCDAPIAYEVCLNPAFLVDAIDAAGYGPIEILLPQNTSKPVFVENANEFCATIATMRAP